MRTRASACLLAILVLASGCEHGREPSAEGSTEDEASGTSASGGAARSAVSEEADATSTGPTKAKVLVIGLDGLDPRLVERWVEDGSLPNLGRLIERGSMTTIDCVIGTSSPVVWTTVATGLLPKEHGVTGFTIGDDPVNASHRRRPALWNILTRHDLRVATVGWMVTWPAEAEAGIVVSDRAWWGDFESKVAPPQVVDPRRHRPRLDPVRQILPRFSSYPYDPSWEYLREDDPRYAVNYLLQKRLLGIFRRDSMYASMAKEVASEADLDVLAVYFQGPDYVGHGFWQWFEPEPFRRSGWNVPEADVERLGGIIPAYYRYVDSIVGEMVSLVADDALVVVLSDHGFEAWPEVRGARGLSPEARFLSGNHRGHAVLILSGPQVRRGATVDRRVTHLDVLPTLFLALDVPRARDNSGKPLVELFTEDFLAARQDRFVESHARPSPAAEDGTKRSRRDGEILEELRALGYIE